MGYSGAVERTNPSRRSKKRGLRPLWIGGAALVAVIFVLAGYVAHGYFRDNSRHLAHFAGGVTFIGQADARGLAIYHSVDLLRATATDASSWLALYKGDEEYRLDSFTPEIVYSLAGGKRPRVTVMDVRGCGLRYSVEDGRLTQLMVDARKAQPGSTSARQYSLAVGNGARFTLPISHVELVRHVGEPLSTEWHLAN